MKRPPRYIPNTREEIHNTITHLIGAIAVVSMIWLPIVLAIPHGWRWMMGVLFMGIGTMLMYSFSTAYHWTHRGKAKRVMRIMDHIGIYIMIACSYTPICIAVIGGWLGWTVFGILWGIVVAGATYKIAAIGKYPRLSLMLYLLMGWTALFIVKPVWDNLSLLPISLIVAEGITYTAGTYFFAYDSKRYYHAIWHLFVLLGTIFHWSAVIAILVEISA